MNNDLVQLLQSLVRIPSINPSFATDPATSGEARMAGFIADDLRRRGFAIEMLEPLPARPNVIARFGPAQPRHTILIEGHTDTQGVHGMTVPPFAADIRGSRLYGRGACDTKGPIAAAIHALDASTLGALAKAGVQVIFAGAMGEERGNIGADQIIDAGITADEILVLEPTDLQIVHAHKGTLWFEIEVHGTAAHGSQPENGCSAIHGITRAIDALMTQTAEDQRKGIHPLLGKPTTNIGVIRGGTSINIVPESCMIEVDRRVLPGEDTAGILNRLREALDGLQHAGHFKAHEIRLIKDCIPYETAADSPMITRMKAAIADAGVVPATCGAGWYSDAGPLSRIAKTVIVFGPGGIAQAHTADEFIEIGSLEKGAAIIRNWLLRTAADISSGGS